MVDHIVSVDDNFNFPPQIVARIEELIRQHATVIADGGEWVELAMLGGWLHSSSVNKARYRIGGTGDKAYFELRGSVTSDGTNNIATFPGLEDGAIPSLRTVYGRTVNNGANQSLRVAQSGLSVTNPPASGVVVSLEGIKVYL